MEINVSSSGVENPFLEYCISTPLDVTCFEILFDHLIASGNELGKFLTFQQPF
jgi:hypothetical protein